VNPHIIIIGGGPGGYAAAFHAARSGARVSLVEKKQLGGTCLHAGCIPTKTLKSTAEVLETAGRFTEFGITPPLPASWAVDMAATLARKEKIRTTLLSGLKKTCDELNIELLRGRAELQTARKILIHANDQTTILTGDALILAVGSKTTSLPGLQADHAHILDSDDALNLSRVPQSLAVVGGGVIGCELAFIFRAFGAQVTVVEAMERLLPIDSVDEEVSRLIRREAKKRGIDALTMQTLQKVDIDKSGVRCLIGPSSPAGDKPGRKTELVAETVLVAVGREPDTEGLNLEAAGVDVDARGWIVADAALRTSVEGIYAVGDALGPKRPMLAHTASAEGLCAVNNILGQKSVMDYRAIPSAIFTSPEIGVVGLAETQAREQGINVRSSLTQYRALGKSHAMGELPGFFKLVCEEQSGKVLGAQIVGAHATDIVAEAALAVRHGLTVADIAGTVHAHPTLAEGLYEAANAWLAVPG
jgi:dihydrolipoamide dehydrogenase